jgi:hypothetical protein
MGRERFGRKEVQDMIALNEHACEFFFLSFFYFIVKLKPSYTRKHIKCIGENSIVVRCLSNSSYECQQLTHLKIRGRTNRETHFIMTSEHFFFNNKSKSK